MEITTVTTKNPDQTFTDESEITKCFRLLAEGEKKIKVDQPEAVLVLGITGSGKTTLVQFLAGDNKKLFAKDASTNAGEYVIYDAGNNISDDSTIISKTIFPERTVDSLTNTTYYDCPGYSDTRGVAVDIAATYFIRKIIQNLKKIKVVLTVNYSAVRTGMDRAHLIELMRSTFSLIQNIEKYKDSIALVVTKVDNLYKKEELVDDQKIYENIVKFLRMFKANANKVGDQEFVRKVAILVDALTEGKTPQNQKIGIFRRPMEEGTLDQNEILQEGKARITKIITQTLSYADVDHNDFGYSISEKSKNEVHEMVQSINGIVVQEINKISKEIVDYHKEKEKELGDVEQLRTWFDRNSQDAKNFVAKLRDELKLRQFVEEVIEFAGPAKISPNHLTVAIQQEKYLEFLKLVGEPKLTASPLIWKSGLRPLTEYLDSSTRWYTFLGRLQTQLSSYDVQKDVTQYRYLLNEKIVGVHDAKLRRFADSQPDLKFNEVEALQIESIKLERLNKMLRSLLSTSMTKDYDIWTDTYEVRGDYVLLSKAIEGYKKNTKFFNIFATNTIFLNCDFVRQGSQLQELSIVAPTWEVRGERKIVLNGDNGCCTSPVRALDGIYKGDRGRPGSPGQPGKSAGNFFGIGAHFINAHKLLITADGGAGSDGQDGGYGANGPDGLSFMEATSWGGCRIINNVDYFRKRQVDGLVFRPHCVIGKNGGNGGHGGNGGVGGIGGYAGTVRLITTQDPQHVRISEREGSSGMPGLGGTGGRGGRAGKSWMHEKVFGWWRDVDCSRTFRQNSEYYDSCGARDSERDGEAGDRGITGWNSVGQQQPVRTSSQSTSSIKNRYIKLLEEAVVRKQENKKKEQHFLEKLKTSQNRRKRDASNEDNYEYAAPIITTRNTLKKTHEKYLKFFEMNDNKNSTGKVEQLAHGTENKSSAVTSLPAYNVNDGLIVIDLLVRAITKSKPNYFEQCSVDYVQVRACAAEIVRRFEKVLQSAQFENLDFDPVPLLGKLEKEIVNENHKNVVKLLLDAVKNKSTLDTDKIYHRLKNALSSGLKSV